MISTNEHYLLRWRNGDFFVFMEMAISVYLDPLDPSHETKLALLS